MHIWFELFGSQPMFEQTQLSALHSVLNDVLPNWSRGLRVSKHETSADVRAVDSDGSLRSAIDQVASPKRGTSRAVLQGTTDGLNIFMSHSDRTFLPESNCVIFEVYECANVEE